MKHVDGWYWPDGEAHMIEWMMEPKNRVIINGRPSYQGKKQLATIGHCPSDRRRTMLDCGAHIGLWSFNFAHWFERIEAFEPVADHRECFMRNVWAEGAFDDDIDIDAPMGCNGVNLNPYALGEREAMVHIRVNPTSTGDSWVKGKGNVPMKTIDSFGFTDVDLIKVDAEGYEEFILLGAAVTIATNKPVIIVEQKRDMATKFGLKPMGAVKYLISMGYKVVQDIGGDYIMTHA